MTSIAGFKDTKNKRVIIGGDSIASHNGMKLARLDEKVFKKGDWLFGCADSFRALQIIKYKLVMPPINKMEIFEYLCTTFNEEVYKVLKSNSHNEERESPKFLIAYKDRLFNMDTDYQIGENRDGIDAIGSGEEYALGALYALKDSPTLTPEEKIEKAILTSEHFSTTVLSPVIIKST